MANNKERMRILEKVESGELSTDDAIGALAGKSREAAANSTPMEILKALEDGSIGPDEAADRLRSQKEYAIPVLEENDINRNTMKHPTKEGRMWLLPLWGGVGFVLLSAVWMASRLQIAGTDFWFFAAWLPLALGVMLISLAWASRNSPWLTLNLRSSNNEGLQRFNLHFPLPLGIVSWTLMRFKGQLPGVTADKLESILAARGPLTDPIVIHAIDDDDGDEVEVIIA